MPPEVYTNESESPFVPSSTYSNYVKQYAGAPINEMYMTAMKLDDMYKTNRLEQDKLETMINNLKARDVNNPILRSALNNAKGELSSIRESGRWEDAGWMVQKAAYNFANDKLVQGALEDKAQYDAAVGSMQKKYADGKVSENDLQAWMLMNNNANRKQVQYDETTGTYKNIWNSQDAPDYVDYAKVAKDFINGANANQLADMGLKQAGNGYLVAGTNKFITYDEALGMAMGYVMQQPGVQQRVRWDKKVWDLNNRGSYDPLTGDIVYRDITLQEFANDNGLTLDENGKLGYYALDKQTKKKVFVPDEIFSSMFTNPDGSVNNTNLNNVFDNMWGRNYLKKAVDPAAQWLDFQEQKYDFHRNWMLEKSIEFENQKKLKMLDSPNPYVFDVLGIPRGEYGKINPNSTKAFLQDGKLNANGTYLTFGENSKLKDLGFDEKSLDNVIKARTDIKNALSKYGSFWSNIVKFDKKEGVRIDQGNWWLDVQMHTDDEVPQWLKDIGFETDKLGQKDIQMINDAKAEMNQILKGYGYNLESYVQQLGKLENLDKDQKKALELYATTLDGMGTIDGEVQGMWNGIDGSKILDVNGRVRKDQMEAIGWNANTIKAFNDLTGKETIRFSPSVKVTDTEGKGTLMDMYEMNLGSIYQPTMMDMHLYNRTSGVNVANQYQEQQFADNMVYNMNVTMNQQVQQSNMQRQQMAESDYLYVIGQINNLSNSIGNDYVNGTSYKSLLSSATSDITDAYNTYQQNPNEANRGKFVSLVYNVQKNIQQNKLPDFNGFNPVLSRFGTGQQQ